MSAVKEEKSTLHVLDNLPFLEQLLLQLVSIIYEPVSKAFLCKCVARVELSFPGGKRPVKDEVDLAIKRLRAEGYLNGKNQCEPVLAEYLTRQSVEENLFGVYAALVEREAPVSYLYGKRVTRCWRALRQFRIGVYLQDFERIDQALAFLDEECSGVLDCDPPAVTVTARAFDQEWLSSLPSSLQFYLLEQVVRYSLENLQHFPDVLAYLENEVALSVSSIELVPFHRLLANYYLLQGRFSDLRELLARHADSFQGSGFAGSVAFLCGDLDEALELFAEDQQRLQEYAGDNPIFFYGITGLFCIFALLARNQEGDRQQIRQAVNTVLLRCQGCPEEVPFRFLDAVVRAPDGKLPDMMALTERLEAEERSLTTLVAVLALHWIGVEIPPEFQAALTALYDQAQNHSFSWLAMETAELLATLGNDQANKKAVADELANQLQCRFLTHIIAPEDAWKQSLQELIRVTRKVGAAESNVRLAWFVAYGEQQLSILPKEQKKTASGGWTKGRSVALNRLLQTKDFDYLTSQDRQICGTIRQVGEVTGKNGGCDFDYEAALPLLVGHPHVFQEKSPHAPVEIVAGEPELVVEQKDENLFIHFAQDIGDGKLAVWPETPTRYRVIEINEKHRKVAEITGKNGLYVPIAASRQVLDAIGNIASFMTVHSSIEVLGEGEQAEFVESDSTVHIHIIPYGSGFRLEMFVRPFHQGGPYLKPGVGVSNLMSEIQGKRLQTRRNLMLEEQRAREVEESCPILDLAIDLEQEDKREWHLFDPEECLQALLELEEIREKIVLEWPEGEKISVRRQIGVNQLNLNIRTSQQDWFALSGQLELDQDQVIELKTLLDKVSEAKSRFIPMGDGQFIALTQEFRNRLEELILFGNPKGGESEELTIHPLAAIALDEFTQQANTTADQGWQRQLQAVADAQKFVPQVPSTLKAELRDYQQDGFVWMSRLANLGVGACLADDMGLGKTLQAIAVILSLADRGPTLVVAPTSVCMNWETEVNRFAPTLKMHLLSGQNREDIIEGLGKFDMLITSYTLLQQEIELLEQVPWQSVVLDEAQAIKNAATKRSRAAMKLKARFKLITTGTPIENHLGELWNLFSFINTGLLGSYKQFNRRFGIPIEKYHDRDARRSLKKLIRPFMLRRIKSQVLDELPPRTEITLRVEMQPEEMQFYEALRQQAIENIEGSAEKNGRHLRILAEIMRLRRACCNPKLIDANTKIASTKLKVFQEVVEELLGGRHKALVFSQFTGHLALIRAFLDEEKIAYKYLDGTTPAKERQRQVESFQKGDGDLFLISLKAGGLGLNLTAADYVIHMDPWWNPAVEDQAADRAHRIGQKRPVTVYRLVTAETIEEKIVRLHQEKRDLANSLLEGSDVSARISAEELLELIRTS
ncbi:DEAD/DEAH box helicase [Desulfogranum mediterraneum]|uniref:DEAD/DEAH box helicase n=1 Tax=Desulfogranum mediterraneum TaxID=160661 RepID=UPI00040D1DF1|nr:DEAD/DEAH box helicase [Desulfogranum mediterraneum]